MTSGNPKRVTNHESRITIWGCGSGTMFAAPPSPALTGPGSLAPAVRVLPFRHRLPPIVAVESRSVNDGADGRGRRHRSRDPARARQRGPAPRRPPSGPRCRATPDRPPEYPRSRSRHTDRHRAGAAVHRCAAPRRAPPPPGRPDPRSGARTPLPSRAARSCARWCGSSASLSVCGGAGEAIGLAGLLWRDQLIPQISLDQPTIAARRISPSAAAAGDQPRDVTPGQPVARALSEDHLTAALMQDLHEIRGSGVTAGHAPRRKFEPAERGRQLCLIGDDPVVADQPASAAELPRAAAVHVERKLIDHDPVPRLGNLDGDDIRLAVAGTHESALPILARAGAPTSGLRLHQDEQVAGIGMPA